MLNTARICVELDVAKPLQGDILIRFVNEKSQATEEWLWVKVFYDVLPLYCDLCRHIGHGVDSCKRRLEENRLENTSAKAKGITIPSPQVSDPLPQHRNSITVVQIEKPSNGSEAHLECAGIRKGVLTEQVACLSNFSAGARPTVSADKRGLEHFMPAPGAVQQSISAGTVVSGSAGLHVQANISAEGASDSAVTTVDLDSVEPQGEVSVLIPSDTAISNKGKNDFIINRYNALVSDVPDAKQIEPAEVLAVEQIGMCRISR